MGGGSLKGVKSAWLICMEQGTQQQWTELPIDTTQGHTAPECFGTTSASTVINVLSGLWYARAVFSFISICVINVVHRDVNIQGMFSFVLLQSHDYMLLLHNQSDMKCNCDDYLNKQTNKKQPSLLKTWSPPYKWEFHWLRFFSIFMPYRGLQRRQKQWDWVWGCVVI